MCKIFKGNYSGDTYRSENQGHANQGFYRNGNGYKKSAQYEKNHEEQVCSTAIN